MMSHPKLHIDKILHQTKLIIDTFRLTNTVIISFKIKFGVNSSPKTFLMGQLGFEI